MRKTIYLLLIISPFIAGKAQSQQKEPLILRFNSDSMYAYYNHAGKKVLGDYYMAYTDTIINFGIVADSGFMLIDRNGKHIFEIFPFDNGPDYTSDGLYRIIKNGKIGYVDSISSKLVIEPIYNCAYPFEEGKAKVSLKCFKIQEGDYLRWEINNWFYIDKKGNKIK